MTLPVWTQTQIRTQLVSGFSWSGQSVITYDFATTATWLASDPNGLGVGKSEAAYFQTLNATQQSLASLAITLWGDLISPTLQQVTQSNATPGDIDFAAFSASAGVTAESAHAYYPRDGTIWLNNRDTSAANPVIGQFGFDVLIHELGHAFGLDHAGNYNVGGATLHPFSFQDSEVYSVMSYFGPADSGNDPFTGVPYAQEIAWANWGGFEPQTPMLNDVDAIQQIYGVSTTTRTGSTTYGFNYTGDSKQSVIYDFALNSHPILCIFDSSGNDTLDLSGDFHSNIIDLRSGAFSSVMGLTNNISIAYSCVIENAVGGSGNDVIYGNDAAGSISGGLGNDNIVGGTGNDVINGGAGADVINGNSGYNTIDYANSQAGVTVILAYNYATGGDAQGDSISNFQAISGSNTGDDQLFGDANVNVIYGNGGNDTISGGLGADYLFGGDGNNTLYYYSSALGVTTYLASNYAAGGEAQGDTIANFQNVLGSNTGNDTILGDTNYNVILGYGGNDIIGGGFGGDYLDGGAGNNGVWYYSSAAAVTVYLLYNYAAGGEANGDTIYNFQNVYGSNYGNDSLSGDTLSNTILGYGGDDRIDGGAGGDYLDGGAGNNTLFYYNSPSTVYVNLAANTALYGDAQGDTILNFQNIIGSNVANDYLWGDAGSNQIFGFGGNDQIVGVGGNDYLVGGDGSDTFVYYVGSNGKDEITDFTIGTDHLQISKSLAANFAALVMNQSGANTIITFGADSIQLDNILTTNLHASDFIFV
jgi:serralysin